MTSTSKTKIARTARIVGLVVLLGAGAAALLVAFAVAAHAGAYAHTGSVNRLERTCDDPAAAPSSPQRSHSDCKEAAGRRGRPDHRRQATLAADHISGRKPVRHGASRSEMASEQGLQYRKGAVVARAGHAHSQHADPYRHNTNVVLVAERRTALGSAAKHDSAGHVVLLASAKTGRDQQ